MSDLQCPAKIMLVTPEMLGQGASIPSFDDTPYSGVFAVAAVADDAGEIARQADHPLEILVDVADSASLARALEELADLYRGYTIVVIATREMIKDLLHGRASDSSRPIALVIDSSGWAVLDVT